MTHTRLNRLKNAYEKMNRPDLISLIWELSSDELATFDDLIELAKENEYQLKNRVKSILNWYEYLAK